MTIDWNVYFMTMSYLIARKSKDKSTNIGAIIVGQNNEIRSTGYNSFVRGLDDENESRQKRPEKYYWMEHAERNAIYNAARVGIPLNNCIMYTQGIPCMDCGRAIVQAGIEEVIVHKIWNDKISDIWKDHSKRTISMFKECNIKITEWDGKIDPNIRAFMRGDLFDVNSGEVIK